MFLAFGLFIVACGGTHLMEVVTVWIPVYVLSAGVKEFTALVSAITALWLPFTIPQVRDVIKQARSSATAETKFRGLLDSAPDGIVVVDNAGRITLANAQIEKLFGYPADQLMGKMVENTGARRRSGLSFCAPQ